MYCLTHETAKAREAITQSQRLILAPVGVLCDTIPLKAEFSKIKVLTTADLFSTAIRNVHENKSINSLFIHSQLKEKIKMMQQG